MRKHLGWLHQGDSHAAVWRESLNRLNTMAEILLLLDEMRAF